MGLFMIFFPLLLLQSINYSDSFAKRFQLFETHSTISNIIHTILLMFISPYASALGVSAKHAVISNIIIIDKHILYQVKIFKISKIAPNDE